MKFCWKWIFDFQDQGDFSEYRNFVCCLYFQFYLFYLLFRISFENFPKKTVESFCIFVFQISKIVLEKPHQFSQKSNPISNIFQNRKNSTKIINVWNTAISMSKIIQIRSSFYISEKIIFNWIKEGKENST